MIRSRLFWRLFLTHLAVALVVLAVVLLGRDG